MRRHSVLRFGLWLVLANAGLQGVAVAAKPTLVIPAPGKPAASQGAPKARVDLLANHTAITPGGSIELAITFEIEDGWHTYWRNRGEGGMEPSFKWHLPEGFTVAKLRFPPPQRHVDALGGHTFILEGDPILLAELTAPQKLPAGQDVTIAVDARWLVCEKACVLETKELQLKLPVVAGAAQSKPANEDTFRFARASLPLPMAEAKYLRRLSVAASVDKVKPGAKFKVAVVLDIATGYHLNSNKPLSEYLIPTDVFHDSAAGLILGRAEFSPGKIERSPLGKISLYTGRVVVMLPAEADAVLQAKQLRISGVVTYQACSDATKQCFPPTAAEWEFTVPVAQPGETVAAANADLFAFAEPAAPEPVAGGFSLDADIRVTTHQKEHSLLIWLVLAFVAGLLLNITPCVLPVISIKVLSFVQQASESPARVFKLGLAFSLGMLIVFNVLAVLATGMGMVWGQHFQSPAFTIAMSVIVFAFALSLFGVFTLGVPTSVGNLATQTEGEGYAASIAKGMFATIMGTPCVGPFLGPVLVWAASQHAATVFLVFNTIGLGMTLPYALLTANPKWLRFVPKPGPWLTIFKQVMAFVLLAIVVHLLNVVQAQLGGEALAATLLFLTAVALGCWIIGTWMTPNRSSGGRTAALAVALAVVFLTGWFVFRNGFEPRSRTAVADPSAAGHSGSELPWVTDFSLARLSEITASGKTVLLDITAEWCFNCKLNKKLVFDTPELLEAVRKHDVVPMLADSSIENPEIEKLMAKLAPGGSVPFCAVFPADRPNEPHVMLGLVTKEQVINAIEQAAAPSPDSQ